MSDNNTVPPNDTSADDHDFQQRAAEREERERSKQERRLDDSEHGQRPRSLLDRMFGRGNNTTQNNPPTTSPAPAPAPTLPTDIHEEETLDADTQNFSNPDVQDQAADMSQNPLDPANPSPIPNIPPADNGQNGVNPDNSSQGRNAGSAPPPPPTPDPSAGSANPEAWNAGGNPPSPPVPWWKRFWGRGNNNGHSGGGNGNAGEENRNTIYLIILAILICIGLLGWQLWDKYRSSQAIDSPVEVEPNQQGQQALVSGQDVTQEYADKLRQAEEERRRASGSGSYVPQTVNVLSPEDDCPNCAERISNLETVSARMVESVTQLVGSVNTLDENQKTLSNDINELRTQIANMPRPTQGQAQPIPEAGYYKDYKGHEYLSNEYLNNERNTVSNMIGRMVAQTNGESVQHYASYNAPKEKQTDGNAAASTNGAEVIPVGMYSGQLEIGVNTDKGMSPLVAVINSGPLRGTRLIARGYTAEREGVQIVFTEFVNNKGQRGLITAYAVDSDTKVAGVASSVDKHITSRVLAAAITRTIQGWGDAYSNQGTTISTENGIIAQTKTTDSKSAIRQGVGAGAGAVADIFAEMANRPTTIEVEAHGYEIGIYVVDPGVLGKLTASAGSR